MDSLLQALKGMYQKAGKALVDDPMKRSQDMQRSQEQRIIRDNFGGDGNAYEQALTKLPPQEDMLTSGIRTLYKGGKALRTRLDALRQALSN